MIGVIDVIDVIDVIELIDVSPVSPVRLAHLWVDFRVILQLPVRWRTRILSSLEEKYRFYTKKYEIIGKRK